MSQGDQRNQPSEDEFGSASESAGPAREPSGAHLAAGGVEPAGDRIAAETSGAHIATETEIEPAAAKPARLRRREFHDQGDGAPRYAAVPAEIPPSGSEQSWSAQPNPGYQRDPAIHYPAKRVVAGSLIGALLMAGFVVYAARILTNRSGNGNGSAPWTANFERDGAAIGGINAPNNGAAPEMPLPAGLSFGDSGANNANAINAAVDACRTAAAVRVPVSTATGTKASMSAWSAHASFSVQSLRANAAALQNALNTGHIGPVSSAANALCSGYPSIAALPPVPDAAGSQAWSSAVSSFSNAATQALQGASGNPDATAAAFDAINQGDKQLDVLSARITSAT